MSSSGESESGKSHQSSEDDVEVAIEIAVKHGDRMETKSLASALKMIRETILESSTSKPATISFSHLFTERIQIDTQRSPNRLIFKQSPNDNKRKTPNDNKGKTPYPSSVSGSSDKEGSGDRSGSIKEIPDDRSDSIKAIPDDRSDSIKEIPDNRSDSIKEIPDDSSGSYREIPDDRPKSASPEERSDSERKQPGKVRPCDEQNLDFETTRTSPEYEFDVDMYSVETGPDPVELAELEVEDMQIDFD